MIVGKNFGKVEKISNAVSSFLYFTQHMIFAISYLRIALVFKLVFSNVSMEAKKRLKNRLNCVYVLGFVLFAFISLPWIVLLFFIISSEDDMTINDLKRYYDIVSIVCFTSITLLLAYSIYRIRKFSKMLVQSKIFANECLMFCHLAAFSYLAILNIAT